MSFGLKEKTITTHKH